MNQFLCDFNSLKEFDDRSGHIFISGMFWFSWWIWLWVGIIRNVTSLVQHYPWRHNQCSTYYAVIVYLLSIRLTEVWTLGVFYSKKKLQLNIWMQDRWKILKTQNLWHLLLPCQFERFWWQSWSYIYFWSILVLFDGPWHCITHFMKSSKPTSICTQFGYSPV